MSPEDTGTLTKHLFEAIRRHDVAACDRLIDDGADVNAPRAHASATPLLKAIDYQATDVALYLIQRGAHVTHNESYLDPLKAAARAGNTIVCRALLDAGAPIDGSEGNTLTALYVAAITPQPDVCKFLIANGANVWAQNRSGCPPLRGAALRENPLAIEAMRALIAAGAKTTDLTKVLDCPFDSTLSVFQSAVAYGRFHSVEFMMDECNEIPEQRTVDGMSMLELAPPGATRDLIRAAITQQAICAGLGDSDAAPSEQATSSELRNAEPANNFGVP